MSWIIRSELGTLTSKDVIEMRGELCPNDDPKQPFEENLWELGAYSGGWEQFGELVVQYVEVRNIFEDR